jgi:hypothetical protein
MCIAVYSVYEDIDSRRLSFFVLSLFPIGADVLYINEIQKKIFRRIEHILGE